MKLSISTGGEQDYLSIQAESLDDAVDMLSAYQGLYFSSKEKGFIQADPHRKTIFLRFYLGEKRKNAYPDEETLREIDATP